jgi:prepilin-type N-terminal cleavage/methylation domain-containing protein
MKKTSGYNSEKGFTVVELLIAISVASIASVLMMYAFVFMYGGLLKEQARSQMVLESQVFLRRMVEDVRIANQILTTNSLPDNYEPSNGWITSDPANIIVITQPVIDADKNFIYDGATGYPYQNEIIYHGSESNMFRRTLANGSALNNAANTTCPVGTAACQPDIQLSSRLQNMQFVFYDINDEVTTIPENARSVELTVNLADRIYGQNLEVRNKTRVTLRNEN